MKERTIIKTVAALLGAIVVMAIGGTDAIYPIAALLFFAICIGYAEWCERL
jgi:predicted histidine transporter YuiF (NhaC family)